MNRMLRSSWISEGKWYPRIPAQTTFSEIAIDSRRIFEPSASLFICLRGPRHDSHAFISDALVAGIHTFVVDHLPDPIPSDCYFLIVPDTLLALQELAGQYRRQFAYPFVGITGSNGKTTVKEWIYALLKDDRAITRSPRSYNSQVGVALSLLMAGAEHNLALIEAGISQPGEMARLENMIHPDLGILTGLGSAHDEGFSDHTVKLQEKLILFGQCKQIIAPQSLVNQYPASFLPFKDRLLTWGIQEPADLVVTRIDYQSTQQVIVYLFKGSAYSYSIPFTDEAARINSIICILFCLGMGLNPEKLHERMNGLPALTMRLETREGWNNNLIINDYYNADLEALRIALAFFNQRKGNREGWIILSDLDETGLPKNTLNDRIASLLEHITYNRLTLIGSSVQGLRSLVPHSIAIDTFSNTEAFLASTSLESIFHTAILLKGARRFAFEKISRRLIRLVHRTRMEIDLSALSHNLHWYNRFLHPETKILVMVKASAYGGGSTEVGRWLAFQRIHYLGVAYVDEGIELRKAGITLPILVMNPDESAFPLILEHGLEPEIHSLFQLEQFVHFLEGTVQPVSIHVKLETGMNRLGFSDADLPELLQRLQESPSIYIGSVMSHLAASENPAHDAFTRLQVSRFCALAEKIENALGYKPMRHILNSTGIRRFPEYQFDMVRLGIGLYGLDQDAKDSQLDLIPAIALKSRITRIKEVAAGDSVGYGRRSMADHDRRIATITIGYADGLLRLAGEGRFTVRVRGIDVPTVGAICMDMAMIDVSNVPDAAPGDDVVLFDGEKSINQLAEALQTIPYEVLTNISARVPRIYFDQ